MVKALVLFSEIMLLVLDKRHDSETVDTVLLIPLTTILKMLVSSATILVHSHIKMSVTGTVYALFTFVEHFY